MTGLSHPKVPSFKTVLLGDASVGKTSLVSRFTSDAFSETTDTTIGAAFCPHTIEVDGRPVKFEIWDTAGQERFASLAPMYYRGAAAALIVYDQSMPSSYERARGWVEELLNCNPNVVICLAANKADLQTRQVDVHEARLFADQEGLLFFETSAKTGQNVHEVFEAIARRLPGNPDVVSNFSSGTRAMRLDTPQIADASTSASQQFGRSWCCGVGG